MIRIGCHIIHADPAKFTLGLLIGTILTRVHGLFGESTHHRYLDRQHRYRKLLRENLITLTGCIDIPKETFRLEFVHWPQRIISGN